VIERVRQIASVVASTSLRAQCANDDRLLKA